MNRTQVVALVVMLFTLGFGARQAEAQSLTISGPCPGVMTFEVTGGTPFTRFAFLHSANTGSWVIPSLQPCAGTVTGLAATVVLGGVTEGDASGEATVTAFVPGGYCGARYVQVLDALSCTLTPATLIP